MTSENVYTEIVAERGAKVIPDLLRGNAGNVGEIGALLDLSADEIDRLRAELKYQTDNSANLQNSIDGLHGRIRELEAELAEARKPDCRFCCFRFPLKDTCAIDDCVDGSRYKAFGPAVLAPVRLYEKE